MTEEGAIALLSVAKGIYVFARDDENVHRRFGVDVREGISLLILIDRR